MGLEYMHTVSKTRYTDDLKWGSKRRRTNVVIEKEKLRSVY